jgi:hypothetical protein
VCVCVCSESEMRLTQEDHRTSFNPLMSRAASFKLSAPIPFSTGADPTNTALQQHHKGVRVAVQL